MTSNAHALALSWSEVDIPHLHVTFIVSAGTMPALVQKRADSDIWGVGGTKKAFTVLKPAAPPRRTVSPALPPLYGDV